MMKSLNGDFPTVWIASELEKGAPIILLYTLRFFQQHRSIY